MSRYTLLGNDVKPTVSQPVSAIFYIVLAIVAAVGIGYAITVYNAQPGVSMRVDVLTYGLANESATRLSKDMVLMYNVSQLSMDVSFLYAALNMTNNTGVQVVQSIIYLNTSVTNNTNDINYIYSLLNVTNSTGNVVINEVIYLNQSVTYITNDITNIYGVLNATTNNVTVLVTDVSTLNQTVNSVFYNVTLLQTFAITNITVGPGLSTVPGFPSPEGGFIDANNPYIQLRQRYAVAPAMASYASITVDVHGVVTGLSSGTAPVTSITAGTGLDGGMITGSGTITLGTAGTAGTYVYPSQIITDVHGRVISVTNGTAGTSGTVTNIITGTGLTGGPISTTGTISLSDISGVQGGYSNPVMNVDGQGRITFITNGTMSGSGTVTSITAGAGLTGGTITMTGTISMPNVGTNGTYNNPSQIITDAQGRVTSVTTGTTPINSISAGTGMSFTTINSTNPSGSVSLSNIPGVQGGYMNPTMSVDGQGRITSIANGTSGGSGTVTSIIVGDGLTGTPTTITSTGSIGMPNVGPGNIPTTIYGDNLHVTSIDQKGRIVSAEFHDQFARLWPLPNTNTFTIPFSQDNLDCNALYNGCYQGFSPLSILIPNDAVQCNQRGFYLISYKMYGLAASQTLRPNGLVIGILTPSTGITRFAAYSNCLVISNTFDNQYCESSGIAYMYLNNLDQVYLFSTTIGRSWTTSFSNTPANDLPPYSQSGSIIPDGNGNTNSLYATFLIQRIG